MSYFTILELLSRDIFTRIFFIAVYIQLAEELLPPPAVVLGQVWDYNMEYLYLTQF